MCNRPLGASVLMSACQSKHLQVGYDILSKPMLVVDMGSSTTDFAYILRGREIELQTAGEVFLGGGIMDEILLEECVEASMHAKRIREVFAASEPWRAYCEFSARRLKENRKWICHLYIQHRVQTSAPSASRSWIRTARMCAISRAATNSC